MKSASAETGEMAEGEIALESNNPLSKIYVRLQDRLGETPKSNYFRARKIARSIEDPTRAIKLVSFASILPRMQQESGAVQAREIHARLSAVDRACHYASQIIYFENYFADERSLTLYLVPGMYVQQSLFDWIRRQNSNNVKLIRNNPADKDKLQMVHRNFLMLASTLLKTIGTLRRLQMCFMNVKTENVMVEVKDKDFESFRLSDPFFVNSKKEERNKMFREPDSRVPLSPFDLSDARQDIYGLGVILFEFIYCQIAEK